MNGHDLHKLLPELWADLHDVKVLWQIGAVTASLVIAWLINKRLQAQLATADSQLQSPKSALGREALAAIQLPVIALVLLLIARLILGAYAFSVNLLDLMVALLVAAVILRIAVIMLRQVFAPSGWRDSLIRMIAWTVWIGFGVYIAGLAPDLIKFLDNIGFSAGKQRVSVLLVGQALLSVGITVLLALWLGNLIESRMMRSSAFNVNLRVMITKLAQALLLLAAILIALPAVGIDLTVLSVFGGMLGVGIGFGLQKIASNYISGFIILLDRSVSIGDLVTVDKYTGQLTKMTARYVVVRANDGTETIIPNETMITSPVVNHSYTDKRVRVGVPVQVGYQSDLDVVKNTLIDVAKRHKRVLAEPTPKVLIREFADNGVNVELGVWIEDPQDGMNNLRSDLYFDIWREFRAHNIEIPYPQREVRILQPSQPTGTGTN